MTSEVSQSITVLTTGTYFVSVLDSNSCIARDTIVVTFSTGIKDPAIGDLFQLYPNPVKNSLFIQINGLHHIDLIAVYNSLAQRIQLEYFTNAKGNTYEINTNYLSAGVYSVEIISGKNKFVKMFVKQ